MVQEFYTIQTADLSEGKWAALSKTELILTHPF